MALTATDPRHGTLNGYRHHRCRCEPCRQANAAYANELYHRRNTTPPERRRPPLRERLYSRISIRDDTDCWLWTGRHNELGYGQVAASGKNVGAHRAVYEWFLGPVPDGLELDHLCRNRGCVNPRHLEPVTHAVNMARGAQALKTHCKQGHPYNEDNTFFDAKRNRRICRTCRARVQRRISHRNRTSTAPWREIRGKRKSSEGGGD